MSKNILTFKCERHNFDPNLIWAVYRLMLVFLFKTLESLIFSGKRF